MHLKSYGPCGPLGFPLSEKQARNLDTLLQAVPKIKEFEYRKTVFTKAPAELNPDERSDVSWISTETPDRYDHIVLAKGMDDSQFALNPIVTLNHDYSIPPIGRSLWRKFVKDGDTRGIKAKTVYPPKPAGWPDGECWQPDKVFLQIQAGLLNGKSIGWLLTKTHYADTKEAEKLGWVDFHQKGSQYFLTMRHSFLRTFFCSKCPSPGAEGIWGKKMLAAGFNKSLPGGKKWLPFRGKPTLLQGRHAHHRGMATHRIRRGHDPGQPRHFISP